MTSNREPPISDSVVFLYQSVTKAGKMPSRCVVYGCSNAPDPANGIILHKIPYDEDLRPEAIKRRKLWVDFVKRKRAKWEPSSSSCVCSKHFKAEDFQRIVNLVGQQETYRPVLKRDDIGITSFPSVYTTDETEKQLSGRAARAVKRKVRNNKSSLFIRVMRALCTVVKSVTYSGVKIVSD